RGVAVGEMIDVRLAAALAAFRKSKAGKARITHVAHVGGGYRVAAESEEAEGAALEAVRHLLAAAADLDQVVAVARGLENLFLLLDRLAGERTASGVEQRQQLPPALLRDRQIGDERIERPGVGEALRDRVAGAQQGLAGHQHVAAERFARQEQPAREA